MKTSDETPGEELQELHHDELPGYRFALWIALALGCIVLVIAFLRGADLPAHDAPAHDLPAHH